MPMTTILANSVYVTVQTVCPFDGRISLFLNGYRKKGEINRRNLKAKHFAK